jgi:transposase-like protein
MICRMASPEGVTATELAQEVGIHQTTLSRWLRNAATVKGLAIAPSAEGAGTTMRARRPRDWTPEEKLQAVIEAQSLPEEELGAFLRRKGLHEAQLREWRAIILEGLKSQPARPSAKPSVEARRIRELEKELERKEKALAEAAALLVLQKKVQALWGDAEASTGKRSAR